jgi:diguanylate cyclase (GGDEF)-like protein/PAS domain S-box-containing protein
VFTSAFVLLLCLPNTAAPAENEGKGPLHEAELRLTWKDHLDILSVGDGVEALLGFKPQDVLSGVVALEHLIHPADLPRVRNLISAPASDQAGEIPVRLRGADSRIRCLRLGYATERLLRGEIVLSAQIAAFQQSKQDAETRQRLFDLLTVLQSTDQCASVKDRNHRILVTNENFRAMLSNDARDAAGMTDYDLFSEEFADRSYEAEERILAGEPAAQFVIETSGRPGTMRSLECRALPVHDRYGRVAGVLSVIADHTVRVRAEQSLRLSAEAYQQAHRIAGLGSFVFDVPSQTWTASDVFHEMLGLDGACGRTVEVWIDLIPAEDHARLSRLFGELVSGKSRQLESETRYMRSTETSPRWARVCCSLECDVQGMPFRLHGTLEDITDRKRAEAKAHESANLLQLFIEDAPAGVAMFDERLCYMSASRRWIEDRALKAWEIVGRPMYEVHPRLPQAWEEEHRRALGGETVLYHEDRFEDGEGRERWVRRMVQPWWGNDGKVGGIVVFSEDITATRKAEYALRESEESLREAQSIAGVGSYVLDVPRAIWTSSEALDGIFGLGASYERTVDGWLALVHPDDREMMASYVSNEVLGRRQPFDKEYRIVRVSDQAVRWVHGLGRVETDAEGRPRILRGTVQDISERKEADASLHESRRLLQLFVEHAPAAIAMFDTEMRYLASSRRWIESFALEGQVILGRSHYDVFPDLPERWKEAHRRGLAGEGVRMDEEELFERADGSKHWIRWELLPWQKSDGSVGGIILFTEDITVAKASTERLRLAASVFTHTSESIVITDGEGTILDANAAFTRIYGYTREEVLGQNPRLLNSGRQSRDFYADMWRQLRETGQWSGEIWNRAKSGQILPGMLTISAVPDAAGNTAQYVGLFSDLSPVKEREQQLRHVAHFDMLTGLPNRALLADRLRQAMARARRMEHSIVLAYLDLDDFSAINQAHGHVTGDQLLNLLSQRMNAILHEADTLARLGGDEFAAVLLDVETVEEGLAVIGRLRDAVAEPVQLDDLTLKISASIGVTIYPQVEEVDPDQLVRQADQAMYFAKLAGKARIHVFDPSLDRNMRGRHEDLQRIQQALRGDEFELFFQPKVNMRSGQILGAEALIRWRHPELGLLTPEHFLPVMEGNLLAVELGEWVIANTLSYMERWQQQGFDVPVSVNIDAMQLQDPEFTDKLKRLLARYPGVQPSKLELEVLESSAFQDVAQISEVIRACGKLGVSFALDDFGTGYSSLSYLRRLPVDVLKIDRSFVHDMLEDPEDLSILEGVLVLANAFHRQVIAEGVETVDHGTMLLRLGCLAGQGYQIARPMRGSEFPAWAATWRPDARWMNVPAIDPTLWPVLHGSVEHRAWVAALEEFVLGLRSSAPPMDRHQCRLGAWLDAESAGVRGQDASFQAVEELHRRVHACASGIVEAKSKDGAASPSESIAALRSLQEGLIEQIQELVHTL